MRQYETVFLISPNLSEEDTESIVLQMADIVSKKKGKMINKKEWGKRKLAYPIQNFEEAFYVLFHYQGKPEIPTELERRFKQSDAIIRYLTVKKEERENIRSKKKRIKPEEKAAVPEEKEEELEEDLKESSKEEGKEEK